MCRWIKCARVLLDLHFCQRLSSFLAVRRAPCSAVMFLYAFALYVQRFQYYASNVPMSWTYIVLPELPPAVRQLAILMQLNENLLILVKQFRRSNKYNMCKHPYQPGVKIAICKNLSALTNSTVVEIGKSLGFLENFPYSCQPAVKTVKIWIRRNYHIWQILQTFQSRKKSHISRFPGTFSIVFGMSISLGTNLNLPWNLAFRNCSNYSNLDSS